MFRYIAFVWIESERAQLNAARFLAQRLQTASSGWSLVLDREGLQVWCAHARTGSSEPTVLHDESGVVLGTLFRRPGHGDWEPRKAALERAETTAILATEGRRLMECYWGRYVAFLQDSVGGRVWVLRDPTGRLPCLSMSFRGVHIFCSKIEDIARLDLMSFTFNWPRIAAGLIAPLLETEETALKEVSNVLGGECVEVRGSQTHRRFYWNPAAIARADAIEDPDRAATALRSTVKACVNAWASCHSSILHRLSGGLDSSIVLGCLRDAPTQPNVTSVNYYSRGSDSDERHFARLAARHAGYPLIELERNPDVRFETLLDAPPSIEPRYYLPLLLERSAAEAELIRKHGFSGVFDGNGGDGLFYQSPLAPTVTDYIIRRGIRPALFSIALQIARTSDRSVWSVLATSLRDGVARRHWSPLKEALSNSTLTPPGAKRFVGSERRFLHPWFEAAQGIPPGKLWHIFNISIPLNFEDSHAGVATPEIATPLVSQPLFELCLRIPTYVLVSGGWDRALARRAFTRETPSQILTRRTKGGMEEHVQEMLARNIDFVRDLLLGGLLVREGLAEQQKLEEILSERPSAVSARMTEIFTHLGTEVWLRSWTERQRRAAA